MLSPTYAASQEPVVPTDQIMCASRFPHPLNNIGTADMCDTVQYRRDSLEAMWMGVPIRAVAQYSIISR